MFYFDAREIKVFRSDDKYVGFVHRGQRYTTEESLVSLERRLAGEGFVRVHRGALVRLDAIRALGYRGDGWATAELDDGTEIPVSRRRLEAVKSLLAGS